MDSIQKFQKLLPLLQQKGTCNHNKSDSMAFDIIMLSLLNAVSEKEKIEKKINNIDHNDLNINSVNTMRIDTSPLNSNQRIENAIRVSSERYGVDEKLIRAIIKVESNFNPNVVSSAGAKGLMQLMPENCKDLGVQNPFNIEENIDAGTRHIKEYLDMYNGDKEMALMAYNGGPTRMRKRGVTSIEHIYKMPKETQNYVPKVIRYYNEQ